MAVLVIAFVVGVVRQLLGYSPNTWDTVVNLIWVGYDLLVMSVIIDAALFKGSHATEQGGRLNRTPARLRRDNTEQGGRPPWTPARLRRRYKPRRAMEEENKT